MGRTEAWQHAYARLGVPRGGAAPPETQRGRRKREARVALTRTLVHGRRGWTLRTGTSDPTPGRDTNGATAFTQASHRSHRRQREPQREADESSPHSGTGREPKATQKRPRRRRGQKRRRQRLEHKMSNGSARQARVLAQQNQARPRPAITSPRRGGHTAA